MTAAPVSVVLLTYNEAHNIEPCLQSVVGWCREIHVVDSGSTDGTPDIARKYTSLVHFHPYVDHRSQLRWVLENVLFACEWLLLVDADLRVSDGLKGQISTALAQPNEGIDGFYSAHRVFFRGRPVRGLKGRSLRLVRHRKASLDDSELVDFRILLRGKTGYLSGAMIEDNANERDIDWWVDKHQLFATRQAVEEVLRTNGRLHWSVASRVLGNHDERMIWLKERWYRVPLFLRPVLYFCYRYFLRLGILDGWNGFVFHFLHAFWFRLLVDVKIDELRRGLHDGRYTLEQLYRQYRWTRAPTSPAPSSSQPLDAQRTPVRASGTR